MGVGLALAGQVVRLYCCVYTRCWHVLLMLDAVCDGNLLTLTSYPNTLYPGTMIMHDGSALIFVASTYYGMVVVFTLGKQRVRLFAPLCMRLNWGITAV